MRASLHHLATTKGLSPDLTALALILIAAAILWLLIGRAPAPVRAGVLAAYTTDLSQRTPHQAFNARRAAAAIDGATIAPGSIFSFNAVVRGWSADRGFLRAPVSYNGTLIDDYGGGVCETSTTLYNAALLAGCPILERHAHTFSPSYAPPGRDAAVAYTTADLRFRNPYRSPITIHCAASADRIVCRLETPIAVKLRAVLTSQVVSRQPPSTATVEPGSGGRRSRWRLRGRDGLTVAVYRTWFENGEVAGRELVSQDSYLPISRVRWEKQ
ncbi:VanW family protein [Capsulimonas corticalis]|uniref:VanW family protein n=1 Tax=Capsulimonas corticalis TaxID=2219043 RepID=UPI000FF9A931|nr:VanW family protein [Capsulimonas corticalis]